MTGKKFRTVTHWGTYDVETINGQVIALEPFCGDPDPSPIGFGMPLTTSLSLLPSPPHRIITSYGCLLVKSRVSLYKYLYYN